MPKNLMSRSLTSSVSGKIIPGACVNIRAKETVITPSNVVGVIGIRQSLADRRLTIGATLIPSDWSGEPNVQFINHGDETIYIVEGDELANVVYLNEYMG